MPPGKGYIIQDPLNSRKVWNAYSRSAHGWSASFNYGPKKWQNYYIGNNGFLNIHIYLVGLSCMDLWLTQASISRLYQPNSYLKYTNPDRNFCTQKWTAPLCVWVKVKSQEHQEPHELYTCTNLKKAPLKEGPNSWVKSVSHVTGRCAFFNHVKLQSFTKLKADRPHPRNYSTHKQIPRTDNDSSLLFAGLAKPSL